MDVMKPDLWAQMRHPRPLYAPTPLSDDPKIRVAQDADRAFRLLYIEHFHYELYHEALTNHDFAGLELMASTLHW